MRRSTDYRSLRLWASAWRWLAAEETTPGRSAPPRIRPVGAQPRDLPAAAIPPGDGYLVARVLPGRSVVARERPRGKVVGRIGATTEFGGPQVMSVRGTARDGRWLAVSTPLRRGTPPAVDPLELPRPRARADPVLAARGAVRAGSSSGAASACCARCRWRWAGPPTARPPGASRSPTRCKGESFGGAYGCCIIAITARQPDLPAGWIGEDRVAIHGTPTAAPATGPPAASGLATATCAGSRAACAWGCRCSSSTERVRRRRAARARAPTSRARTTSGGCAPGMSRRSSTSQAGTPLPRSRRGPGWRPPRGPSCGRSRWLRATSSASRPTAPGLVDEDVLVADVPARRASTRGTVAGAARRSLPRSRASSASTSALWVFGTGCGRAARGPPPRSSAGRSPPRRRRTWPSAPRREGPPAGTRGGARTAASRCARHMCPRATARGRADVTEGAYVVRPDADERGHTTGARHATQAKRRTLCAWTSSPHQLRWSSCANAAAACSSRGRRAAAAAVRRAFCIPRRSRPAGGASSASPQMASTCTWRCPGVPSASRSTSSVASIGGWPRSGTAACGVI